MLASPNEESPEIFLTLIHFSFGFAQTLETSADNLI